MSTADARPPVVPNFQLRSVREARSESRREFARALAAQALATGENLACDEHRVARWERGEVRWPCAAYRRVLTALLGVPVEQLGFARPLTLLLDESPAQRGAPAEQNPAVASTMNRALRTPGTLEGIEAAAARTRRAYESSPVRAIAAECTRRLELAE